MATARQVRDIFADGGGPTGALALVVLPDEAMRRLEQEAQRRKKSVPEALSEAVADWLRKR